MDSRVLLQVDLEGHSKYMAAQRSKIAAAHSRIELAKLLEKTLADERFKLLSWKGDGGVYTAKPLAGSAPLDFAVNAAIKASKAFSAWRSECSSERKLLRFRVSLHWAPDIYTYREPGYWSSDDLNLFMKYERDIGLSGTVAVTDTVFKNLSANCQEKFTFFRDRFLALTQEPLVRRVFYHRLEAEVEVNRAEKLGFFEWITGIPESGFLSSDDEIGPSHCARGSLGDAAFLFTAPQSQSPLTIDLKRVNGATPKLGLDPRFLDEWEKLRENELIRCSEHRLPDALTVAPVRIALPLSDIPFATVEWETERWSRARTFHALLLKYREVRVSLSRSALKVLDDGLPWPGVACCHCVVRVNGGAGGTILACQRQTKGPPGLYGPGLWSFSFEEQIKPGETVNDCVLRGLREELVGSGANIGAPKVLAIVMEKRFLNIVIMVLVDLPLTLSEVAAYWKNAIDKDEHRQLATIALDRDLLCELALENAISCRLRGKMFPADQDGFKRTDCWDVHPTSAARAALALWVQEQETESDVIRRGTA